MRPASLCLTVIVVCAFPLLTWSFESPNAQMGRQLFESTQLGTNGQSCASCHGEGKGLENIVGYDDATLKEMINFCIRDGLRGKMFDLESQELEAMLNYLRSLTAR